MDRTMLRSCFYKKNSVQYFQNKSLCTNRLFHEIERHLNYIDTLDFTNYLQYIIILLIKRGKKYRRHGDQTKIHGKKSKYRKGASLKPIVAKNQTIRQKKIGEEKWYTYLNL